MRTDVQDVFRATPTQKQVMMFSATLSDAIKPICRKFMQNPTEHYVDEDTKLTLHGLQQYYVKLEEKEKNRKLNELLDDLSLTRSSFSSRARSVLPSSTNSFGSATSLPSPSTLA